eukprot:4778107-Pyramimonas_sp.AAC.1
MLASWRAAAEGDDSDDGEGPGELPQDDDDDPGHGDDGPSDGEWSMFGPTPPQSDAGISDD